jgi:hypothetical protein
LSLSDLLQTGLLLLDFHGLAAAGDGAGAPLGDNHLGAALGAAISFAYRICHVYHLFERVYPSLIICPKYNYCQSRGMELFLFF